MNFKELVEEYGIAMNVLQIEDWSDPDGVWAEDKKATHWNCVIFRRDRTTGVHGFSVDYHMGSKRKGEPKIEEVLMCVAYDINSVHDFDNAEDWVDEMSGGERMKAREVLRLLKVYDTIKEQDYAIKDVFKGFYEDFLSCEEE